MVVLVWTASTVPPDGGLKFLSAPPSVTETEFWGVPPPIKNALAFGTLDTEIASPTRSMDMLATSIFLLCMASAFG